MSLNFNLSNIEGYKDLCWIKDPDPEPRTDPEKKVLNPTTNTLIWATVAVDLGGISAKDLDEWEFRLAFLDRIGISPSTRPITREELEAHVGLTTNVIDTSRAKWMRKVTKGIERDLEWSLRKKKEAANA